MLELKQLKNWRMNNIMTNICVEIKALIEAHKRVYKQTKLGCERDYHLLMINKYTKELEKQKELENENDE